MIAIIFTYTIVRMSIEKHKRNHFKYEKIRQAVPLRKRETPMMWALYLRAHLLLAALVFSASYRLSSYRVGPLSKELGFHCGGFSAVEPRLPGH